METGCKGAYTRRACRRINTQEAVCIAYFLCARARRPTLCKQFDDPERELTLVPSEIIDSIIRYFHDGLGRAHQAAKATAAKIIRISYWPDLEKDVRFYIASCLASEKYKRLSRTPITGMRLMLVS